MSINIQAETKSEADSLISFLHAAEPSTWELPTACEGWTVRHVVSHLIGLSEQTVGKMVAAMAKTRMDFDAMVERGVQERLDDPAVMLARLERAVASPTTPRFMRRIALGEFVCHSEDIYRAAGVRGVHRPEVIAEVGAVFGPMGGPIKGKTRAAGLQMRATDGDMQVGDGPAVVEGPGIDLVMGLLGRTHALEHLSGDGVETLRSRCP